MIRWFVGRVGVIYVIVFLFSLSFLDLKMLEMRIKIRHLNDAIPNFSDMIIFTKDQSVKKDINWKPYKNYFELILRYIPDDLIIRQFLGVVDYYTGQEQEAITLFKSSSVMNGKYLFWPNYNLGVLYYKKGMWLQASGYLLKAVASNPQLTIWLMQGSMVYRQISLNPYFKDTLSGDINEAQSLAYILLLSSLNYMKQYDKMIVISNLAIADQHLSYKDAFYYYEGFAFFEANQINKAFLLFEKSLTIEKNNPDVYYYIADIYQEAGQLEMARDFLQVSYALHQKNDPRFPYEAQANLRFF